MVILRHFLLWFLLTSTRAALCILQTVGKMTLGKMLEGGPAVLKGSEGQRAAQASAAAGAPAAPVQQPSGAAAEVLEPAKAPEQRPLQGKVGTRVDVAGRLPLL